MSQNDDERAAQAAERVAELCREALGHADHLGSFRLRVLLEMILNELAKRPPGAAPPRAAGGSRGEASDRPAQS